MERTEHLKVEIFIPQENVKTLIDALNRRGYLTEENYDYCYAQTNVMGHFRPLTNACPYLGQKGKIEEVAEAKLEFRIRRKDIQEVYRLIREYHPYEVPVINVIPLYDMKEMTDWEQIN